VNRAGLPSFCELYIDFSYSLGGVTNLRSSDRRSGVLFLYTNHNRCIWYDMELGHLDASARVPGVAEKAAEKRRRATASSTATPRSDQ
jgi:hypothetical protein